MDGTHWKWLYDPEYASLIEEECDCELGYDHASLVEGK